MIGIVTLRDLALITAAAVAVLLLPGAAVTFAVGGRGRSFAEWVALGFGTSVALVSLVAEGVHRLGGDVVALLGTVAGLAFLALPAGLWRPPPAQEGRRWDWMMPAVVAVAIGVSALAVWEGLQLTPTADTFYHIQAARSLCATGSTRVTDPFFGDAGLAPDATSGTWPSAVSIIALLSGQDALPVMRALVPLVALVFPLAFYALARRFGAPAWGGLVATVGLMVGGMALDLRNVVYPSRVAPLVFWAGLIWLVEWLASGGFRRAAAAVGVLAAAGMVHLSVAEVSLLAVVLAVTVAATWRAKGTLKFFLVSVAIALLFAVLVFPSLAPLARSATLGMAGVDSVDERSHLPVVVGPGGLAISTGEGLAGVGVFVLAVLLFAVLALWLLGRKEAHVWRAPPIGLGATLPLLLLNGVATGWVLRRFWYHVIRLSVALRFAPYAVLGALMPGRELWRRTGRPWRWLLLTVPFALVGLTLTHAVEFGLLERFAGPSVPGSIAQARQEDRSVALAPLVDRLRQLGARKGTVVAAPVNMSYELAGLVGYRVMAVPSAHQTASVLFGEGRKRLADAEALFGPATPPTKRARILEVYEVELAVVPAPMSARFAEAGWVPIEQVGDLRVFAPRQ